MREAIFDLPVFIGDRVIDKMFVGDLTRKRYLQEHDLFQAGIKVNASLQPTDQWSAPCFENLRIAGSLIGNYAAAASGTGSGVALLSGFMAGQEAAS